MSLIDAVVLHDTLYTLPCRRIDDLDELSFQTLLIREGILEELDTRPAHPAAARSLLSWLESVPDLHKVAGDASEMGKPLAFEKYRYALSDFLLTSWRSDAPANDDVPLPRQNSRSVLDDTSDPFMEGGNVDSVLFTDSFNAFGQQLIGWIEYGRSGAYEYCVSILRDAYYVLMAEHYGLPYWPQNKRVEFARSWPSYFTKAQRLKLYVAVASAFKSAVSDVFGDQAPEIALAPPFATLVLTRCKSVADIPACVLEVRHEFSELRTSLNEIERERQGATSLRRRLRLRRRQQALLTDLSQRFDRPATAMLEPVLRYVPDLTKAVTSPTNPAAYTADLLLKPAAALAAWWRRRPISPLFDVADRIADVEQHPEMIRRLWGQEVVEQLRWIR